MTQLFSTESTTSTSENLCCALYDAFLKFIHAENLKPEPSNCKPELCIHKEYKFIQEFVDDSNENAVFLTWGSTDLEFHSEQQVSDIADLLLFAYIGRHFTDHREETHPLFKYNFATNVLRAVQPHCVFERRVYLSMIVLTVVVLVFVILSRHIPNAWKVWKPRNKKSPHRASTHANKTQETDISITGSAAIDFNSTGLRQR
jgi:hypothetical protein